EARMHKESVRKFGAFSLMAAIWLSAISFYPASAQTPETSKDTKTAKAEKKDEKKAPQTNTSKVLSPKEDPAQIGKRKINSGADKLFGWLGGSQEKEIALGRQLAMEVEQQAKMIDDPIITEYVNRVGQNVVLHSDAKIPFTIKVIDSDEVNAFALPGGFFFVNKGLILAADNESELAGVMAHEIAHVAARHAMENQGKMQAIQYGLLGTILFGGGIASTIAQNAGGFAQLMSFLSFSRGAETEADVLGVQYLYASGYDPTGMSTMFEKLNSKNKKKPGTLAKVFATHPQSVDRRDATLALVARFPEKEEYVISTSEFQRVKAHLLKITNAKAGITTDIDEDGNQKPTLKRRQPENPNADEKDSGSSSSEAPPQLKRRDVEPTASPSPDPTKKP
ncbi:MAG TPA: M48 family metallopeptidase, partial [Pyrinomonadaceae bacterium]|nr:M48 family metallopeptidase [Pyrinomonadaceae bacterium]